MKLKIYHFLLTGILICSFIFATGQELEKDFRNKKLFELYEKQTLLFNKNKSQANKLAKLKKWPLVFKDKNNKIVAELVGVGQNNHPLYYAYNSNVISAITSSTFDVWPDGNTGFNLNGSSAFLTNRLAIFDGGGVRTTHQEFVGRITQKDNPSGLSDHATHVMGTMMAKGVNPAAKGMSFELAGGLAYDWNNDIAEAALAANGNNGILLSNHSYGYLTGWNYNGSTWRFYGPAGFNIDPGFGYYDESAQDNDENAYNAPYYLPVRAAGNNRSQNGPDIGAPCQLLNANGNFYTTTRPIGISSNDGYTTIGYTSNAKNIIAVGAINPIMNGYQQPKDVQITDFSSWGPTRDGRLKPDLVSDGYQVYSTYATTDQSYSFSSGTSMACPGVTGALLLLQELYGKLVPGKLLRNSTIKGIAIHTANEAGNYPGPDFIYGWGLLNTKASCSLINEAITKNNGITSSQLLFEKTIYDRSNSVDTISGSFISSGSEPLKLTICWTDPIGQLLQYTDYTNDTSLELVNDLDIWLIDENGKKYFPWVPNFKNPTEPPSTGNNNRDNVEKIETMNATPGIKYTYYITYKNMKLVNDSQTFALLVSGVGGSTFCPSKSIDTSQTKIDSISINNLNLPFTKANNYADFRNKSTQLTIKNAPNYLYCKLSKKPTKNTYILAYLDLNNSASFDSNELLYSSNKFNNNGILYDSFYFVGNNNLLISNNLLRLIVVDTPNVATFSPCGTYNSGSTIDINSMFKNPDYDIAFTSFITPQKDSTLCFGNKNFITVRVANQGNNNINNLSGKILLLQNGNVIDSALETFNISLEPYSFTNLNFQKKFIYNTNSSYSLKVLLNLTNDFNILNNTGTINFSTFPIDTPSTVNATAIGCGNIFTLNIANPKPNNNYYWFINNSFNTPIFSGNGGTYSNTNNTISNFNITSGFQGNFGALNFNISDSGNYHNEINGGGGNYFQVYVPQPAKLTSGKMYTGNWGTIQVNVFYSTSNSVDNAVLMNSYFYDVLPSSPQPTINYVPKNKADSGFYYNLNINFPNKGYYVLQFITLNGASLFRNSQVTNYPFPFGNPYYFYLTTNSANSSSFYYYLYDMNVSSLNGCPSAPANVSSILNPKPALRFSDDTLYSSLTENLSWYKDGLLISSNPEYIIPLESGRYRVQKNFQNGCQESSEEYVFTLIPKPYNTKEEIGFKLYPTIINGNYTTLEFKILTAPDFAYEIYDISGVLVYQQSIPNLRKQSIFIPSIKTGIYFFRFKANGKFFNEKIFISNTN